MVYTLEEIGVNRRTKPITYTISETGCWKQNSHPIRASGLAYVTRFGRQIPINRYVAMIYLGEPVDLGEHYYRAKRRCESRECINPKHLYWEKGENKKVESSKLFIRSVYSFGRIVQEYKKAQNGNLIRIREGFGVVEHLCSKCSSWKHVNLFSKRRGVKTHVCTLCHRSSHKLYYHKNKDKLDEQNKRRYEKNKEDRLAKMREYRRKNKIEIKRGIAEWHAKNPSKKQGYIRKREVMSALLGGSLTTELYNSHIKKHFDSKCALTGSEDTHLEHFIPSSTGHGDTSLANCYPLEPQLNYSKNKSNPFEWIKREDVQQKVSKERWDNLVSILANQNELTIGEYKEFVYWCFSNPRTIEDLKENSTPSITLWKEQKYI